MISADKHSTRSAPERVAPTKGSLKEEQELEREERAQKTKRLRELRLAKEAADLNKDQP